MFSRGISTQLQTFLSSREPIRYAHLIKMEKPSLNNSRGKLHFSRFIYLTDGSINRVFDDGSLGPSGANGAQVYIANKVIQVPTIIESSEATANAVDLVLDGSAIGAREQITATLAAGILTCSASLVGKGFMEGDTIRITNANTDIVCSIVKFPTEFTVQLDTTQSFSSRVVDVIQESQEIVNILTNKSSDAYVPMLNRNVTIYKCFYNNKDEFQGSIILFKGIVFDVKLNDSEESISVTWRLNSHWANFAEVRGRVTSDEMHRALDENAIPRPSLALKPDYAFDKGFLHAEKAVNLLAEYNVQVEKQSIKLKKGFFGIGAKVKIKTYYETEERQTRLDFNLSSKSIPIVYGVRELDGIPCFADTLVNDPSTVILVDTLCEGPIGGIYDISLNDKSLICLSEQDSADRGTSTNNESDILCYGRADRGDVLSGSIINASTNSNYYNTTDLTNQYTASENIGFVTNFYQDYTPPASTTVSTVGLVHASAISLTDPIKLNMHVFTGEPGQSADPLLVKYAKENNFRIQQTYWGKDASEYWGPNHRLMDTAYTTSIYKIAEGESSLPDKSYIVKGKFIECYNYDNSYTHDPSKTTESISNFLPGDTVSVYSDGGILLGTNKISAVKVITNTKYEIEKRIVLMNRPNLGYSKGYPTITKFYIMKGANRWSMLTFNNPALQGVVPSKLESTIPSINTTGNTVTINTNTNITYPVMTSPYNGVDRGESIRLEY